MKHKKHIWIGLFAVTGDPNNPQLAGCPGAYVTVLSIAKDKDDFRKRIFKDVKSLQLKVDEVVWSETLEKRLEKYDLEPYLQAQAKEVELTGQTKFGVFHAWEKEE